MFDARTLPPEFLFSHQSVPKNRLVTASPREKHSHQSFFLHCGGHEKQVILRWLGQPSGLVGRVMTLPNNLF